LLADGSPKIRELANAQANRLAGTREPRGGDDKGCIGRSKFRPRGGGKTGRALVKSCVTLAVDAGIEAAECINALEYLRNPQGFPCFGYFYERDLLRNRPNEVFHCVAVSGDPRTRLGN
jgi:hypothetical protein